MFYMPNFPLKFLAEYFLFTFAFGMFLIPVSNLQFNPFIKPLMPA